MPWISDYEYDQLKNPKKCKHCGSTHLKFSYLIPYCTANDKNPVIYICMKCGKTTEFLE